MSSGGADDEDTVSTLEEQVVTSSPPPGGVAAHVSAFATFKVLLLVGVVVMLTTSPSVLRSAVTPFGSSHGHFRHSDRAASAHALCGGHTACLSWHTSRQIRAINMSIILVANDAYQQFPLTGYGGIETTVEKLAWGLHAMDIPFAVVAPRREAPPPYPFPIYDTSVFSNGKRNIRAQFALEALDIVAGLHVAGDGAPFLLWGQSDWSADIATAPGVAAAVVSHHDGAGPPNPHWDRALEHVRHRFLSQDQRSRWLAPADPRYNATAVVPHGLGPDDFIICPDGGYFLWVASLDWGWEEKGLAIFVELAKRRPGLRFVSYGSAAARTDLVERLHALASALPNFEYRGALKRGEAHRNAFCGATAFLMPTQPTIGESFGMTVIEALSKGVPVISSTSGAVPELIGRPYGTVRRGDTPVGTACESIDDYLAALDTWGSRSRAVSEGVQAWAAERYSVASVVDALLALGLKAAVEVGALQEGA